MVWSKVGEKIEAALDSITFEQLLRQYHDKDREHPSLRRKIVTAGKGGC
jgi:DNA-binding IscR family transcriptional regulator